MTRVTSLLTIAIALVWAPVASAQHVPLARFLPSLISSGARIDLTSTPGDTQGHFVVGAKLSLAPAELNKAIALQLTTFPLNLSWSGISVGERSTGSATRDGWTFGSSFAERAATAGRGRFSLAFAQEFTTYASIDGTDLGAGDINFFFEHDNCCPAGASAPFSVTDLRPELERDLLVETLSVDLDRNVFTLFANYGVTDRLDLGVAVPIVKVNISGRITSRILRTSTAAAPSVHSFDILELANRTIYGSGHAAGLGDILVRAKYNFLRRTELGLAAGLAVRVPTGDADELLGTGAARTTATLIWSGEFGRVSPHVNAGYTWSAGDAGAEIARFAADMPAGFAAPALDLRVPDEFNLTGGFEVGIHRRVTVAADVVGRRVSDMTRFRVGDTTFPSRGPGSLPSANFVASNDFLLSGSGALALVFGVAGARVTVGDRLLLNADILFPIVENGLRSKVGAVAGFTYGF